MGKLRWVFLPLGLCALVAVGAHAAADAMGERALLFADRVDAFFDAIFARWSLTAPLVDLVGPAQRTFFARALALCWELSADALLAVPLLNYQERAPREELAVAQAMLRKRPSLRVVQPAAALLGAVAGARAVAKMMQASLLHFAAIGFIAGALTLLLLLILLVPRAAFRSLEHASSQRTAIRLIGLLVLVPLAVAAVVSL